MTYVNILFVFFIGLPVLLHSQTSKSLIFHSIDNTNGLPHNYINDITRDSLGFLWIATNDGLCRYDSPQSIKNFKKGDLGIESSNIRSLSVGSDNTLWIGTRFGGLTRLNSKRDTFKTYTNIGKSGMILSNDEILSILEINQHEIWVGTENGLNIIDSRTDSITQLNIFDSEKNEPAKAILDIFKDDKSMIWVGTWDGSLYLYLPPKSGKICKGQFRRFGISKHSGSKNVWRILQDSKGRYWIATHSGGLYLMQLPPDANNDIDHQNWNPIFHQFITSEKNPSTLSSDYIQDIEEDANGNIWIASVHGLNIIESDQLLAISGDDYTIEPLDLQFKRQFDNPSSRGSLNNNNINVIYQDNQDLIWLGSKSGLNQFNWYTNQFELYNIRNNTDDDNKFELINNIYLENDSTAILASDINGILKYDIKNHKLLEQIKYDVKEINGRVSIIHPSEDNILYIGTIKGVAKINQKDNSSKLYKLPYVLKSADTNIYISCIFKDSKDRLWGGTERGLFILDEKTGEYTFFKYDLNNSNSIADNSITHIFEDSQHNIWFCTFNGLSKLNYDKDVGFITYKRGDKGIGNKIPSNQITSVSEHENKLYFGTHNGVFLYDLKNQEFESVKTGHKTFSFQGLEITSESVLWGSTSDGILRLDLHNKDYKLYTKNDGIGDRSFRINSSFIHKRKDLYFGGVKGFLKINSSNVKRNTTPPPVYLTEIETIDIDKADKFNATKLEKIYLDPNNYYISISFAALNQNQAEYNQYAYKLEGFADEEWKHVGSQQKAIYTNLDHGEYIFRVKASNNEGIWNEEGTSIRIIARAGLLEKAWFKILMGLALMLSIYIINNLYTSSIKKRNQFLKDYNHKLNKQINIAKNAEEGLLEREKSMKILLAKLDDSNKELVRSNKDLEQFAYVASHDMKEPLRTVGTFSNLLNRKYKDKLDSAANEYIEFITDGVDRMSSLINSLLTYSQVGKKDVEFRRNNINNIVDSKIKDLSKLLAERKVDIQVDSLPEVYCVGDQIGMVFYNLILNGIKFNKEENPIIKIKSLENDSHYTFSVQDNGIGIAKQYQSQIFEIFKRLHSREEYEGTGIGLALCNKIIDRHDGSIWLDSTPEKGTTFYFTISKDIKPTDDLISKDASSLNKEVEEILRA